MTEETLAFRRLVERFGRTTQKLGHFHHTGTIRATVGDDQIPIFELACECGAVLGPWRDM
jgi:hypothetical protein